MRASNSSSTRPTRAARLMAALKLQPASATVRRGGGRPSYHRDPAIVAAVTAIRLENFREALRAARLSARHQPRPSGGNTHRRPGGTSPLRRGRSR